MLRAGRVVVDSDRFLAMASALANRLPDGPAALNLCERRDNFLLAFVALLMRGQVCLLPPSRAPTVVAEVMANHPDSYRLDDDLVERRRDAVAEASMRVPDIPPDRAVVIGYTSGSTGRPQPVPKTWGALVAAMSFNALRIREALRPERSRAMPWVLATVPPQHMYGMELSVLLPLLGGVGIHAARPLYPADIAAVLQDLPVPRILVTTPVHLRALLQSPLSLPPLDVVVCATAPLDRDTAVRVERRFGAALVEFFGSTETCVIASRRTACEDAWRPYPGVSLQPVDGGTDVAAPWFAGPVLMQDILDLGADGRFIVRGRNADMVEVGGKRASLGDLTQRLLAVPGVTDAVVFQLERSEGAAVQRLAALVVAEGLTEAQVLEALRPAVDPVFLPRPLVRVGKLPRNELGKLPREQLLAALKR
jgi:acyl-coenzyme A synthetase/AMP-(fatty) acid ligase